MSRSPSAHFIIQSCAYSDILEQLQGRQPSRFEIILGDNARAQFKTNSYFYYYRELRLAFEEFLREFDPSNPPQPGLSREHGRWTTYAERILEQSDHLSVVANISRGQIRKFEEAGVPVQSKHKKRFRIKLTPDDFRSHRDLIGSAVRAAVEEAGIEKDKGEGCPTTLIRMALPCVLRER